MSKTDQERKGTSVFIEKTRDDICPVAAMSAYLAVRGPSQGPVFQYTDARPLTKVRFTDQIRDALATIGYDPKSYAGHSFRIGAASTAAERGVEDSSIKALGRWKSDAFQAYIKLPRATLAPFAKVLSSPSPCYLPHPSIQRPDIVAAILLFHFPVSCIMVTSPVVVVVSYRYIDSRLGRGHSLVGEGKPPGDGFLPQSPLSNALIMLNYLGHMLGVRGGARPSIRHTVT